jgi:[acyl-carrier-protein] S-malonyltransferase
MKTAWLFPGQGSQFCGMGRDLWSAFAPAREVREMAENLSGLPLGRYSLRGPIETLTRTDALQPAVTAINIGCALLLKDAGYQPDMVAGHSLGEFSALFVAGVLTAEETLRLVVERGRAMQRAAEQRQGAMFAVKRLSDVQVDRLVAEEDVFIANYNSPDQTVVSGAADAMQRFAQSARKAGGECIELPVAGAWHSPAMEPAAAAFERKLDKVRFRNATCPIYLNTTAAAEMDSQRIETAVRRQMLSPVRWRQSIEAMRASGASRFFEVGPGKTLRGLLRRICLAEQEYTVCGIEGPRSLAFIGAQAEGAIT